jgi:hypothetical protein
MASLTVWEANRVIPPSNPVVDAFEKEHGILSWASTISVLGQDKIKHIYQGINNPHATILIIQNMCMGIIFTDHTLQKMEYFRNIVRDNFQRSDGYGGKHYVINTEWDTNGWSVKKLNCIHAWINNIDNISIDQVKRMNPLMSCEQHDIAFLEAMSWNPTYSEESSISEG